MFVLQGWHGSIQRPVISFARLSLNAEKGAKPALLRSDTEDLAMHSIVRSICSYCSGSISERSRPRYQRGAGRAFVQPLSADHLVAMSKDGTRKGLGNVWPRLKRHGSPRPTSRYR
jgi:hypothetical protein